MNGFLRFHSFFCIDVALFSVFLFLEKCATRTCSTPADGMCVIGCTTCRSHKPVGSAGSEAHSSTAVKLLV